MIELLNEKEIWFVTGSQHLYGEETLKQVSSDSKIIVKELNKSQHLPLKLIWKETVKTADEIIQVVQEANVNANCVGVVTWMHTFSPAKMWIKGLTQLVKPLCHLHTQFHAEIPWDKIDMDYMNLHQSAHGGREFGFMMTRLRKKRKIIVGHWQSERVQRKLGIWSRVALGWNELQHLKVARIGDNMRNVAVTEGDKVEAEIKFGVSVNGYDSSDVVSHIDRVSDAAVTELLKTYEKEYVLADNLKEGGEKRGSLVDAAKIELGL